MVVMATAQKDKKFELSAGPEIGESIGSDIHNSIFAWGFGVGVSAQGEYFITHHFTGAASIGFNSFMGRSINGSDRLAALTVMPIRGGIQYYPTKRFHVGFLVGIGIVGGASDFIQANGTTLSYSPQAGYWFKIFKKRKLDLMLKYDDYSYTNYDFGSVGLRAAYIF